jgi:hypothetical protein
MTPTMNPLLFADWGRMNRLFTKLMWTAAAVMVCVVLAVLASTGRTSHAAAATQAAHSASAASIAVTRGAGASR